MAAVQTLGEALAALAAHRRELRDRFGVREMFLFGSFARGEARPDSDVDVLVEFEGRITFDRYMDLRIFLEDLLGRRVDLVVRRALRPRIRPHVESELVEVA